MERRGTTTTTSSGNSTSSTVPPQNGSTVDAERVGDGDEGAAATPLRQERRSSRSLSQHAGEQQGQQVEANQQKQAVSILKTASEPEAQRRREELLKAWQEQKRRRKPSVSSSTTTSSSRNGARTKTNQTINPTTKTTIRRKSSHNSSSSNSYAQPTFAFANRSRRRLRRHSLGNAVSTNFSNAHNNARSNGSGSSTHSMKPPPPAAAADTNRNTHNSSSNPTGSIPRGWCAACSPPAKEKKQGQQKVARRRRFSGIPTPPARSHNNISNNNKNATTRSVTSGGLSPAAAGALRTTVSASSKRPRGTTPPLHPRHHNNNNPQLLHKKLINPSRRRLSLPAQPAAAEKATKTTTSSNNRFQRLRQHRQERQQQRQQQQRHSLPHVETTNANATTPSKVIPTVSFGFCNSNNDHSNHTAAMMEAVSPLTMFSPDGDNGDSVGGSTTSDTPLMRRSSSSGSGLVVPNDDHGDDDHDDRRPVELFAETEAAAGERDVESAELDDNDDDDDDALRDDAAAASRTVLHSEEPPSGGAAAAATDEQEQQDSSSSTPTSTMSSQHHPEELNSSDLASSELDVILSPPQGAAAATATATRGSSGATGNDGVTARRGSGRDWEGDDDDDCRDSAVAAGLCRFQGEEEPVSVAAADDDDDNSDAFAPSSNQSAAVLQQQQQDDDDHGQSASRASEIAERVKVQAMAEAFDDRSVGSVVSERSPASGCDRSADLVEAASDDLYKDADYEKGVITAYRSVADNERIDEDECTKEKSLRVEEECPLLRSALADFNKENVQSPTLSVSKQNRSASFLDNAGSNGLDATGFEKDVIDAYSGIKDDEATDEEVRKIRLSIEDECPHLQSALDELGAFDWRQEMFSPDMKPPVRRRADVTDLPEELRRSGSANARAHPPPPQRGSSPPPPPNSMFSPSRSDSSCIRENDSAKEEALATTPAGDPPDQVPPFRKDSLEGPAEEEVEATATPEDDHLLSDTGQDEYSPLFDYSTQMVSPPIRSRRRRRRDTILPVPIRDESPDVDVPKSSGMEESPVLSHDHSPDQPEPEDVENVERNDEVEVGNSVSDSHEECGSEGELSVPHRNDEEESSGSAEGSSESDAESESDTSTVVQEPDRITDHLKVDGKSVLTTLHEDKTDNLEAVDAADHRRLLVENRQLRDKLHTIRSDYDQRVTPFRDLFDERRKTRNENNRLVREMREMEERLHDVQKKAMAAVHVADQKTKFLQAKLLKANQENESAAALRAQLEEANSEIAALKERLEG